MDAEEEARLMRWYNEIESDDEQQNNERVEIESEDSDRVLTPEEPFPPSESEYEPSSNESESSEDSSNGKDAVDSEDENNSDLGSDGGQQQALTGGWKAVTGLSLKTFPFTGNPTINVQPGLTPVEIYRRIITDDILNMTVDETNRNAKRYNRKWKDTTLDEMLQFFAIILYMGLVKYPKIADYWSRKFLYRHCFVRRIMSRNRFQSLLRFLHFADNEGPNTDDRLYKINPLLEALTKQYKSLKTPSEILSIDESMVPFRGRLSFRQYIPSKASKYGVKLFKLCDDSGYTYESQVYKGKSETQTTGRKSNTVVMNLLNNYLDQGHTLVADNYYNNVELTRTLLSRKTHVLGTLRKNTKNVSKQILSDKGMKKGDIKGEENDGVVVGCWKDKRAVRFITTRHDLTMNDTGKKNRKGESIYKPQAIIFYNKYKAGIDISDQMSSYFTVLRRSIRWYHKVAFEYLFGTSVVNALILYQKTNERIQISEFREKLVTGLLDRAVQNLNNSGTAQSKHLLQTHQERTRDNRKKRKRCVGCYEMQYKMHQNSKMAAKSAKLVATYCATCPDQPSYYLDCFQKKH